MITYTLIKNNSFGDITQEYHLTAKTDLGARRQAKAILKDEEDLQGWALWFFRTIDGCHSTIDI